MSRFKFRFESVEKVRKIELDRQRKRYFEFQKRVQDLQDEQNRLLSVLESEVLRQRSETRIDHLPEVARNFKKIVRGEIAAKDKEILAAKHEVFKERKVLNERLQAKRVMERLREREGEKHDEENRKRESQTMDEVATNLWIYRRHRS